jgi:hypothetical protein
VTVDAVSLERRVFNAHRRELLAIAAEGEAEFEAAFAEQQRRDKKNNRQMSIELQNAFAEIKKRLRPRLAQTDRWNRPTEGSGIGTTTGRDTRGADRLASARGPSRER